MMLFRKYTCSPLTVFIKNGKTRWKLPHHLPPQYINNYPTISSAASELLLFSDHNLKALTRSRCYLGPKFKSTPRPYRNRRNLLTNDGSTNNFINCHQQEATFMSLPGTMGAKKKEYAERRIMGFSMEQMYDVVSDVEKYQQFLPWCQKSLVKIRRKNYVVADLIVGFPPLVESYTSSVTLTKPNFIRAESTEGKLFNQLITTWKFNPGLKGKPQSCVVDFYVSFEFRSVLTSQLANVFFNEVVRTMAGAFYNEAKKRYGAESIPSRKVVILTENNNKEK